MQKIVDTLHKFDRSNGWYYVAVPHKFSEKYRAKSDRGLIAVTARVKEVKWNTSLLPMGDGSHFIPIPQKIRSTYGYQEGDPVEVCFELR